MEEIDHVAFVLLLASKISGTDQDFLSAAKDGAVIRAGDQAASAAVGKGIK